MALTRRSARGRTSSAGESRSFVYGPNDRIERMTDATGTTHYEYDSAGRFSGIVYPHGGSVRYVRDALGRTVRVEVRATATAAPLSTGYAYDEVGNLSEVVDHQGGSTTFVYDAENRLSTRTLPNGVVSSYTYDARDRPLSVVHTNASGQVLVSRTYVRAPGGEPTKITKEDGSWVDVGYDSALRITSERYFDAEGELEDALSYTYDADGNRATKTVNGVVSTYHYASGARLTGITTNGVTVSRGADAGGRETSLTVDGRQLTLTYDSDDHVTRVVDGQSVTEYAFDAAGRRVAVTSLQGARRFLTAPNAGFGYESPQAITNPAGEMIASYVFAGQTPLLKRTSTGNEYYLTDAMGSVVGTSDDAGSLLASREYDAFGQERAAGALPSQTQGDFGLHGMWMDPGGLYYVRARVYDTGTGRFTSMDKASMRSGRPESSYPYVFANNNGRVWLDPSGRTSIMSVGASIAISTGLAAIASVGYHWAKRETRFLYRDEQQRLQKYFGPSVSLGAVRLRGGGAPSPVDFGERAWTPTYYQLQLPDSYFAKNDPTQMLDFGVPGSVTSSQAWRVAQVAHEVLHNWQRERGYGPTGEGIGVQALNSLGIVDAYDYRATADQQDLFSQFMSGTCEQQGQIFQDYVYLSELGDPRAANYSMVADIVRRF